MALSLYRKYRPEVFSDVIGQEHVEKTLINAITEGAVAHAYLFCGPRGTGKTTTARLLAKALLCDSAGQGQPDGTCPQCLEIAQGTHPDVFELDAASRTGVDNVREEIIGRVGFAPTRGTHKVYIIDEVHMLSTAAFNALLKTLEEPPEHVVFILCTTDPHKVPETIQSRCQRFDFRRFSVEEIVHYLERISTGEGYSFEPEALEFIAAKSAGGMRDATTALEQVGVYTEGNITLDEATRMFGQIDLAALFEISEYIARRDTSSCFIWINDFVGKGIDLAQFAKDLAKHLRDLYVTAITGGGDGIVACTAAQLERYRQQAAEFGGVDRLARALDICGSLVSELRNSSDARLSVEIAMTRLTQPTSELTLEALAERIEALELRPAAAAHADAPAVTQEHSNPSPQVQQAAAQPSQPARPVAAQAQSAGEQRPAPAAQDDVEARSAAATPASASTEMSPERLLAAILAVIRRSDEATAALLSGVTIAQENGGYVLVFPAGSEFQLHVMDAPDKRATIGGAFAEVLGQEASFDYRMADGYGAPAPAKMPAQPQSQPTAAPVEESPDDGYYDALAAQAASAPQGDEVPLDIADALSAFGAGVTVQELSDDE